GRRTFGGPVGAQGTRRPSKARWLLPALLVIGWLLIGGVGGPYAGKLSEIAENGNEAFLPESAESTDANALAEQFSDSNSIPAFVVAEREGKVTEAERGYLASVGRPAANIDGAEQRDRPVLSAK